MLCCAAQLEEVVTVHKKHVQALEKALRCLDNDALTSDDLDQLKDDLEYYLVSGCVCVFGGLQGSGAVHGGGGWVHVLVQRPAYATLRAESRCPQCIVCHIVWFCIGVVCHWGKSQRQAVEIRCTCTTRA
jgi:hypothetical protein